MESGVSGDRVDVHAELAELAAQDPCCFYKMVDACLRRHDNREKVLQDGGKFIHPSAATKYVLSRQQAAGEGHCNNSSSSKAQTQARGSISTTSSSTGAGAGGGLLNNWKQTHAFLSAVLSYRKVVQLLWESASALDLQRLDSGLRDALLWFSEEGVLDALGESGAAQQRGAKESSSSDAAGAGGGKAMGASTSSSADSDEAAADPEEAAACRMLALCVLSRVTVTYCQQLAGVGGSGNKSSSSSYPSNGGSGGASVASKLAPLAGQLKWVDFGAGNRLRLGCSLGVACYCLAKQVQQYGSSNSRGGSKGGSSSSNSGSGAASGAASNGGSSKSKSGEGSSSKTGEGSSMGSSSTGKPSAKASSTTSSSSSSQKWGGLQLELPPSVLERLQKLEAAVTYDTLQQECAFTRAVNSHKVLVEGGPVAVLGVPDYERMVQLLEQLMALCEGVVAAVPLPLGCNNPSCTSLDGVSEASAAKVCSGCKKAHYCGTACMKAHWKEHKPYCK